MYNYPQMPDLSKQMQNLLNIISFNAANQNAAPSPAQTAQIPAYTCQPVKNIDEVDNMKWFNDQPFFGVDESGDYIFKREWNGKIPAANTVIYKRIERSELPQPPRAVTHDELTQLLPAVLAQYVPAMLKQMGVTENERQSAKLSAAGAGDNQQLSADAGGSAEGTVRTKSGKNSGDK